MVKLLSIDDTDITRVFSTKCLGVIINKDLKWKEHVDSVANKVSKSFGILNKVKTISPV